MSLHSNKLYLLLGTACFAGYFWIYLNLSNHFQQRTTVQVCLFKNITTLPCPSCGTTRSMISLYQGNFMQALQTNPFGVLILLIMVIAPVWIAFDVVSKQTTLFRFYKKMETNLQKPIIAIPLILLVIINWIWNITKGI